MQKELIYWSIFLPKKWYSACFFFNLTDRLGGKEAENKNLVFHFGGGRHASFPQKPVVIAKIGSLLTVKC